jgi:hypothetical protein
MGEGRGSMNDVPGSQPQASADAGDASPEERIDNRPSPIEHRTSDVEHRSSDGEGASGAAPEPRSGDGPPPDRAES